MLVTALGGKIVVDNTLDRYKKKARTHTCVCFCYVCKQGPQSNVHTSDATQYPHQYPTHPAAAKTPNRTHNLIPTPQTPPNSRLRLAYEELQPEVRALLFG